MIKEFLTCFGIGVLYIVVILSFSAFLTHLSNKYFNKKDK